ncbi:MAG: nucleoside transporter C-terminal domain-containing protein [Pirellulales bacterium]|nr:nucleoside transporter C-terminal domain-containing protein [Pirellulales bacterium]
MQSPQLISLGGLFLMLFLAWLLSANKTRVDLRLVILGVLLQLAIGYIVLNTAQGYHFFNILGNCIVVVLDNVDAGAEFVFGPRFHEFHFAFKVLPTIIFISSLMSILYYLGVMQAVVKLIAFVMQKTLGTSGAESLSAAANIFVGQTEAPLLVKPYLKMMTQSELMAVMVGGFATIAGGVMAAFIGMGISALHLLTASLLSAPAGLVIAKIMQPEVEEPLTRGTLDVQLEPSGENILHAATNGARDGLLLALNVAAMLIAFMALISLANDLVYLVGTYFHAENVWTIEQGLGYIFAPLAWCMGIEWKDCEKVGSLLGIRVLLSELNAYALLSEWIPRDFSKPNLDEKSLVIGIRSQIIATYALCGFSTFASIGIQIGGLGALAPNRQKDFARLAFRAMLGGNLASFMTACVAGIFLSTNSEVLKEQIIHDRAQAVENQAFQLRRDKALEKAARELMPQIHPEDAANQGADDDEDEESGDPANSDSATPAGNDQQPNPANASKNPSTPENSTPATDSVPKSQERDQSSESPSSTPGINSPATSSAQPADQPAADAPGTVTQPEANPKAATGDNSPAAVDPGLDTAAPSANTSAGDATSATTEEPPSK